MANPYGRAGVGISGGADRRTNRARSAPTGWGQKHGEVTGQELQFENGYKVLAVTIPGAKATIKGAEAWHDFLSNVKDVAQVIEAWLSTQPKTSEASTQAAASSEGGDLSKRMDTLETGMNQLIKLLSEQRQNVLK